MVAAAVWSLVSEHVKTAIAVQVVDNEEDELVWETAETYLRS